MGSIDTITAVDPSTVEITLNGPDRFFLGVLPKLAITSAESIDTNGDEWFADQRERHRSVPAGALGPQSGDQPRRLRRLLAAVRGGHTDRGRAARRPGHLDGDAAAQHRRGRHDGRRRARRGDPGAVDARRQGRRAAVVRGAHAADQRHRAAARRPAGPRGDLVGLRLPGDGRLLQRFRRGPAGTAAVGADAGGIRRPADGAGPRSGAGAARRGRLSRWGVQRHVPRPRGPVLRGVRRQRAAGAARRARHHRRATAGAVAADGRDPVEPGHRRRGLVPQQLGVHRRSDATAAQLLLVGEPRRRGWLQLVVLHQPRRRPAPRRGPRRCPTTPRSTN